MINPVQLRVNWCAPHLGNLDICCSSFAHLESNFSGALFEHVSQNPPHSKQNHIYLFDMELLDSTRQVVSLLYLHRQYSVAELCLLLPQKVMMIAFRRDFADHAFLGHTGT